MMRIRVQPEQLESLSRNLQQSAEQFRQMTSQLNQTVNQLAMQGAGTESVTAQWQQSYRLAEQIFAELSSMGVAIHTKAETFYNADMEQNAPKLQAKGTAVTGSPVSLFASLRWNKETLILPGNYEFPGIISNPKSAIHTMLEGMNLDSNMVNDEDGLLQMAIHNPQAWKFTNPSGVN